MLVMYSVSEQHLTVVRCESVSHVALHNHVSCSDAELPSCDCHPEGSLVELTLQSAHLLSTTQQLPSYYHCSGCDGLC